jgi:hypothetical protein
MIFLLFLGLESQSCPYIPRWQIRDALSIGGGYPGGLTGYNTEV